LASLLLVSALHACAGDGPGGADRATGADERALWSQAEKEERTLATRETVYGDADLEEYLARIATRLAPLEWGRDAPPIRVVVFRDATLNAFAMPNRRLFIHTGLLARLDNEAQLATILSHELAHMTSRHALAPQRGEAGIASSGVLGPRLPLTYRAAVTGYGQALEREADAQGMARMVEAGYDPREAPRAYERLGAESDASSGRETFFFGNRRRLQERIRSTQELLPTFTRALDPSRLQRNTDEFPRRVRAAVRDNAALDIGAGRFAQARAQLDRARALAPGDPVTRLYYGDLYRLQAQRATRVEDRTSLLARAREEYEQGAALDPAYPDPFRQLGFLYYQIGQNDKAVEAFRRYLALKPDAPDAPRIAEYVTELSRR
jgi:beta-barrel assembly-enhancing protease